MDGNEYCLVDIHFSIEILFLNAVWLKKRLEG
jgi:hypothetical protein